MDYPIKLEKEENNRAKFHITRDNEELAKIVFEENERNINVEETLVKKELRGQGIARKLVEKVIEYSKKQDKKLSSSCSYAKKVIDKIAG